MLSKYRLLLKSNNFKTKNCKAKKGVNMLTAEFKAIVEDFEFIDDWEDRYRYIIEKGKTTCLRSTML